MELATPPALITGAQAALAIRRHYRVTITIMG